MPDKCTVTGTLYDQNGNAARNVSVFINTNKKASFATKSTSREVAKSDTDGVLKAVIDHEVTDTAGFEVLRGATVKLQGKFFIGSTDFNPGVVVQIPNTSTVALESFGSAVTNVARSIWAEVPSGALDGSNQDFVAANTFAEGTLRVTSNGQRWTEGVDYTLSDRTVTSSTVLNSDNGDWILFDYETVASGRLYHQSLTPDPDGSTTVFTLPSTPANANDAGFKNGFRLNKGTEYTINGPTITFTTPPETGDYLEWDYD